MNLYPIYKLLKQRSKRHPENGDLLAIAKTCRDMFDGAKSKRELVGIVRKIIQLEKRLPISLKRYGNAMLEAIEAGDYSLQRPHEIAHIYKENAADMGYIYLLESREKPGQVKLGATSLDPHLRASKYEARYGYGVRVTKSLWVKQPFKLESFLKSRMINKRVSGRTYGDSNEWYQVSSNDLWKLVINIETELS